ncbi:unnamed protein product [Cuscuta epithymum]|uniref:Uncharacterized protein n=1 Tax=Cuscuta epithymum TaxID=186058 RepID=A0AAV0F3P2_9ASTE|nr:unnamed protein product [Cuscuta epithymum]
MYDKCVGTKITLLIFTSSPLASKSGDWGTEGSEFHARAGTRAESVDEAPPHKWTRVVVPRPKRKSVADTVWTTPFRLEYSRLREWGTPDGLYGLRPPRYADY